MNPVFFSKKVPSIQRVLSRCSVSINFYQEGGNQNKLSSFSQALVICDKKLQDSLLLQSWRKNKKLHFYYVESGEKTKSLEKLSLHIQKINSLISDFDKSSLLFIGLGGGSIIDLTGFLASIYKRGLPVVFIPSTWLSAVDSAHGGKNALNFQNIKNLLGTYYFPKAVFIVEGLLKQNPKTLKRQAYGELLKIAFIQGGGFYKKLKQSVFNSYPIFSSFNFLIEQLLKEAIESKMKIVQKDPFEKKEERKKLNLGHTLGHILEAVESLPHGLAVLQGLLFSLNWSYYKSFVNKKNYKEMKSLILFTQKAENFKKISLKQFKYYLKQDKKHKKGMKIDFIFIEKPGKVFTKLVSEKDLIQEAKRQALL